MLVALTTFAFIAALIYLVDERRNRAAWIRYERVRGYGGTARTPFRRAKDEATYFAPVPGSRAPWRVRAVAQWSIVLGLMVIPGAGFGDIALVPAPFMKDPKGIRDVEEWYVSTAIRKDYVREVFEHQCTVAEENIRQLIDFFGDRIDVAFITGTDFGTQRGQFISTDAYREMYKPYHIRVNSLIHERSKWKTFIHSCGSVFDLVEEFIEAGFDILNPVQCSAACMEPTELKRRYGDNIVFWGGGVDTQKTLPFGAPDEVYRQVRERIDIFFEDSTGFVFNAIHNVTSNVPTENILAMFRALDDARKS